MVKIEVERLFFCNLIVDCTRVYRNFPQIIIQVLYIIEEEQVDIFVLSAMMFSSCSAFLSFCFAMSNRIKHTYIKEIEYHYRKTKVYKMRIECEKFGSQHKYTHKLLTKTICSILRLDNTGNIQVFYIVSARNAIIAYIEVSNADIGLELQKALSRSLESTQDDNDLHVKRGLFEMIEQLGDAQAGEANGGGELNKILKQELNEKLNLGLSDSTTENTEDGVNNGIKIMVAVDKTALSYDVQKIDDVVKVKS